MRRKGLLLGLGFALALLATSVRAEDEAADEALGALEARLVSLREAKDERGAAGALGQIASRLVQLRRYDEALERHAEIVSTYRAMEDPSGTARALYGKAGLEMALQRLADAEASYAAGVEALTGVEEPRAKAVMWLGLSRARRGRGNAAGALEAARAALEIQQTLDDACRTAKARGCVGACLFSLGRYAAALEAHLLTLEVFREHDDVVGIAGALTNLGNVYLRIGSHAEARTHYEEALGLYRDRGDQRNAAVTLSNLGIVHETIGEHERARERYAEALAILGDGTDRRQLAPMLAAAGVVDMRLEQYDEALAKERRAIELYASLKNPAGRASALVNVANILERRGELAEAQAACDQADAILGEDGPPAARAAVMWSRARIFLAAKQPQDAVVEARRAIDLIAGLTHGLADTEEAGSRDVYDGLFDVSVQAAVALGDAEVLAAVLEESRAIVLRDGLAVRCALTAENLPDSLCAEMAEVQTTRRDATKRYQDALTDGNLARIRATRAELEAADDAFQHVMRRAERRSKAATALTSMESQGLDRLKTLVGPHEVLVLYGMAEEVAVALVVRPDGADVVRLGASPQVLEAVEMVCACERDRPLEEIEAAIDALHVMLVKPLALPEDTHRVLVSPVGALGFVPFCVLLPECEVAYVPSGTTYAQLRDGEAAAGQAILAVGDPASEGLSPLPAAGEEVEGIGTVKLVGKEASESELVTALGREDRWRAVHFACHGLVDPERPMLSALALSGDGRNDGHLTCHEILQLRVPADLVVLSACETGRGRVYRTEGIVGLTRAFLFAGADRVMSSLWAVDDDATQALMTHFYASWNPSEGKALGAAAALRRAQRAVRDDPAHPEWKHPFYWAAWVLWGLPD